MLEKISSASKYVRVICAWPNFEFALHKNHYCKQWDYCVMVGWLNWSLWHRTELLEVWIFSGIIRETDKYYLMEIKCWLGLYHIIKSAIRHVTQIWKYGITFSQFLVYAYFLSYRIVQISTQDWETVKTFVWKNSLKFLEGISWP
jgi:hypothetical protein